MKNLFSKKVLLKSSLVIGLVSTLLTACVTVAPGPGRGWVPGHWNHGYWVPGHYVGAMGPGGWVPGHFNRWGRWVPGHSRF